MNKRKLRVGDYIFYLGRACKLVAINVGYFTIKTPDGRSVNLSRIPGITAPRAMNKRREDEREKLIQELLDAIDADPPAMGEDWKQEVLKAREKLQ